MRKLWKKIKCKIVGHDWRSKMYINPDFVPHETDKIILKYRCKRCNKKK